MANELIYKDFDYIQGQIEALQAVILGLAQGIPKEEFREQSLYRLEIARNHLIYSSHDGADTRIKAIDQCEKWVKNLTE